MKTLEEIKKEFEKFWTDLFGGEYDGTHPQGQIWNFIESTISQTKQELVEEIKKEIESSLAYGDEYCESEDCHWGDAQSIVDGVLEKLSNK